MVRREIEIDEDTDRIPTQLVSEYAGDLSLAVAELAHAHEGMHEDLRCEADFREGRTLTWNDVKAPNGL
jgi:hypothetical protein